MATALQSAFERISENHECSVCRGILRQPKLLHCAHTFCKSCLQQCHNWGNNGALNSKMLCPVCRQETVLPRSGVEGLKTNFELQSLLEEIFQLEIPSSNSSWQEGVKPSSCKTHKGEMLKLYCETCQTLACDICAGADHSDPEHVMIDTDTASKKYRESLKGLFPAFGQDIKYMKANIRRCTTIDKEYLNKIAEIRKVVQDKASEAIAKVRSEETRLLDEIKSHEEDHTERMHEQKRAVKRLLTRKQRSLKLAKDFAREAGDEEFLSFYPASCKGMKKLQDEHLQKPMGLHSVPVLLGSQGIATGANLGNVVVKDVWELHRELGKKGNGDPANTSRCHNVVQSCENVVIW
ncbi:tripartite motif-containing protein 2-like [Patiria miniata]|uniref:Uncharacterized protein n=1 Tax=Patiria miniata TaxID=46514 RepID=A0A914ALM4_PATMI|nr:tripartite motif-containing protein 2-like [Patiria miniata]